MEEITIENIRELSNCGNLKAFVTVGVVIGGEKLRISGCRIIQQPGQRAWVALPQNEWTDREGTKQYSPVIELPQRLKEAIQETVLTAWERGQND